MSRIETVDPSRLVKGRTYRVTYRRAGGNVIEIVGRFLGITVLLAGAENGQMAVAFSVPTSAFSRHLIHPSLLVSAESLEEAA